MTQHEYVFVAVSIILGLAITRLLHTVAMLIRAHQRVSFHWSTTVWALSIMAYILQLWWVGWELRGLPEWDFIDFLVLVAGSICIYGAAELALPVPEQEAVVFLEHSQSLGRLSALSMLMYFAIGPYVNLTMYNTPLFGALFVPIVGIVLMLLVIFRAGWFKPVSLVFAGYTLGLLYMTA
jgi:hypothetical protein